MANTFNYAEKYSSDLLQVIMQGSLTQMMMTSNVNWLNAETFNFTQMSVSGMKDHSRNGGWNRGSITQTNKAFTIEHDRDVEFFVDKVDVDETARTAAVVNITNAFVNQELIPEIDAYTFSKIASIASDNSLTSSSTLVSYTKANVVEKLIALMGKTNLKLYRGRGTVVGFVRSEIMDLLAQTSEFGKSISVQNLSGESSIETRIVKINGVSLIEVLDDTRFYDSFDFAEGFAPITDTSKKINVMFVALDMVYTVPKISSIYYHSAGSHTLGDGDLYQHRALWDTFVFPNGKANDKVDSIFVDIEA